MASYRQYVNLQSKAFITDLLVCLITVCQT